MKIESMLAVLRNIYNIGGLNAALSKIERWQELGWLLPSERAFLYEMVARWFEPPAYDEVQ